MSDTEISTLPVQETEQQINYSEKAKVVGKSAFNLSKLIAKQGVNSVKIIIAFRLFLQLVLSLCWKFLSYPWSLYVNSNRRIGLSQERLLGFVLEGTCFGMFGGPNKFTPMHIGTQKGKAIPADFVLKLLRNIEKRKVEINRGEYSVT